jgi:hypothetical protein
VLVTNAMTFKIYSDHLLEYREWGVAVVGTTLFVIILLSTRMWETIRGTSERGQRGADFPPNNVHMSGECDRLRAVLRSLLPPGGPEGGLSHLQE